MDISTESAVFGGGCFWCTEAVFSELRGVISVESGYAGGGIENPDYRAVSSGVTGHAEVIKVEYNPEEISYRDLLEVFFSSHDPTTMNRQGNDVGEEYRSVIFYTSDEQKEAAEAYVKEFIETKTYSAPIVTQIFPLDTFYKAEEYHQDYYQNNKEAPYCQIVINPKLEKLRKQHAKLLK
ncbi:MAG: peptide-methionine (S)-S-oxide reductase MsrA [Parcubacteria group bacterium]|nr:peptide-methionine (S)-S-oxide reductase MsrA [Parcubacteria group bacterium]